MPIYLKQSTASQEVPLGYFVDSTDGDTAMTALTIANTDIKIWKAGATTLANKNSGGATHISGGVYYAVLDATDTNTLGSLVIFVHVSGALAVRVECVVLAANIYDSLIGGGDVLDVSTTQFNGSAVIQSGGRPEVNTTHAAGTAWGSGAITAASIASNAIAAAKIASGAITSAKFAAGAIDATAIATGAIDADALAADAGTEIATAVWANGTRSLTVLDEDSTTLDLDATIRAAVGLAAADLDTQLAALPTAAENADAVWDEDATGHQTQGTFGQAIGDPGADTDTIYAMANSILEDTGTTLQGELDGIQADTEDIQSRLPAALVSGRIDASVGAMASNVVTASAINADAITAAKIAADVTTELQSGLATSAEISALNDLSAADIRTAVGLASANLDTQLAAIDTETDKIASIKTKTDSLTFTEANKVDSNIKSINDVTIVGDGSATPFNV